MRALLCVPWHRLCIFLYCRGTASPCRVLVQQSEGSALLSIVRALLRKVEAKSCLAEAESCNVWLRWGYVPPCIASVEYSRVSCGSGEVEIRKGFVRFCICNGSVKLLLATAGRSISAAQSSVGVEKSYECQNISY